jgi:integrase
MGAPEVTAFLSWLATDRNVAAATQNQALAALLFLYKAVLGRDLPWFDDLVRAKRPVRLPVVLSEAEVRRLLEQLDGMAWMMASLIYGAGLRLQECLMLRVKDVDFAYRQVLVRDGKGAKDRVTMLPECVVQPLQAHLGRCARFIAGTSRRATEKSGCPTPCRASIRARDTSGPGSSCFRPRTARPIRNRESSGATTSIPTR